MIDRARAVNGWTMQEVHDMHKSGEHCNLIGQQPDVIEGLKKYGIILSCGPDYISEAPAWIRDYGPKIEPFIEPFRTWIELGVALAGQHYGAGALSRGASEAIGGAGGGEWNLLNPGSCREGAGTHPCSFEGRILAASSM